MNWYKINCIPKQKIKTFKDTEIVIFSFNKLTTLKFNFQNSKE